MSIADTPGYIAHLERVNAGLEAEVRAMQESLDANWVQHQTVIRARKELAESTEYAEALQSLLRRIRAWDMLDHSSDGPYWRREIHAALAKNPNPAGHPGIEPSDAAPSGATEDSGPVGLGPTEARLEIGTGTAIDRACDAIMAETDEETRARAAREGVDIEANAERCRAMVAGTRFPLAVMAGAEWNILDATGARVAICATFEGPGWQSENAALARLFVHLANRAPAVPVLAGVHLPEHTSNCAFNLPGTAPCDCGASYRRHAVGTGFDREALASAMTAAKDYGVALGTFPAGSDYIRQARERALVAEERCLSQGTRHEKGPEACLHCQQPAQYHLAPERLCPVLSDAEVNAEFKRRNPPPPNPGAPTMKGKQ